ncbi:MAG: CxxH/CxxC protein [Bacillaceae bacterium]|nr:CxxH/CxxC protein [Bacillaceae bacterium]
MEKLIDEYETAPLLEKLTENQQLSTACEYCENKPAYLVANIHSSTK